MGIPLSRDSPAAAYAAAGNGSGGWWVVCVGDGCCAVAGADHRRHRTRRTERAIGGENRKLVCKQETFGAGGGTACSLYYRGGVGKNFKKVGKEEGLGGGNLSKLSIVEISAL